MTPVRHIYKEIVAEEIRLQETFADDCGPQMLLLERAMMALGEVMTSIEPLDPPHSPGEIGLPSAGSHNLVLGAQFTIGVRALRVIQAARLMLAAGYEREAMVNNRIIVELVEHRRAIREDETGEEARQWLTSPRGRGIGKRIQKMAQGDLYKLESYAAHGDPRLIIPLSDPDRHSISLAPARSDLTGQSLVLYAGFLIDHIKVIGELTNSISPWFASLRKAVEIEWEKFNPSSPPGSPTAE
jgi:hypothetical protein